MSKGLRVDDIEPDGRWCEGCQKQNHTQQRNQSGDGQRIAGDRDMSEPLARWLGAKRTNHRVTRTYARALTLFLREWSQVLDHRCVLHHLRLPRRICEARCCEMPNALASDTVISPWA